MKKFKGEKSQKRNIAKCPQIDAKQYNNIGPFYTSSVKINKLKMNDHFNSSKSAVKSEPAFIGLNWDKFVSIHWKVYYQ